MIVAHFSKSDIFTNAHIHIIYFIKDIYWHLEVLNI